MPKVIVNTPWFRLLAPLLYGIMGYFLLLLIFDRISQVGANFELVEIGFCMVVAYAVAEGLHGLLRLVDRTWRKEKAFYTRILLLVPLAWGVCALICVLLTMAFFRGIIGYSAFSSYAQESNAILLIYFVGTNLYLLIYAGTYYLSAQNERLVKQANLMRENLELQLQHYLKEINPELLYHSLEQLLLMVQHDPVLSDEYLSKLSLYYRYQLRQHKQDLVPLHEELKACQHYLFLFSPEAPHSIVWQEQGTGEYWILGNSLLQLVERIVQRNLFSPAFPLEIELSYGVSESLVLKHTDRPKLNLPEDTVLDMLNARLALIQTAPILPKQEGEFQCLPLPLFTSATIPKAIPNP